MEVHTFAIPIWRSGGITWKDSLAQLVEHNTFNVGVSGSSPERVTKRPSFLSSVGRARHF